MMDPRFKTIKDTTPEFTESMLDMDSVFEFELLVRWVPKKPDSVCSYKRYISGIYTSRIHWVDRGTGTPKDRDEVNIREVCECDG